MIVSFFTFYNIFLFLDIENSLQSIIEEKLSSILNFDDTYCLNWVIFYW